jgi:hypothetical protein
MIRLLSLMVIGPAVVGSLLAVSGFASKPPVAPEWIAADTAELTKQPLGKSDRLPSFFADRVAPRIAVEREKITPVKIAKEDDVKDDIVSWHWHEGSKVIRRRRIP